MAERLPYPPVHTQIDAQRVTEFAEAVGADPQLGIPPTFAAVYVLSGAMPQLLGDASAGIDVRRMLHGEQEFEWENHPRVGERLTAVARVTGDETRGTLRRVPLETRVTGDHGRAICASRSLMVVR